MISSLATSLSGLQAATKRIGVSAENIANIQSTGSTVNGKTVKEPYLAKEAVQSTSGTGGVRVDVKPKAQGTIDIFDNDTGSTTQFPNVDLSEEVVTQKMAVYDFRANLKAMKVQDENEKSLLNILS